MEVFLRSAKEMKKSLPMVFLLWVFAGLTGYGLLRAETEPRALTLVYSNNINGEIEPCPT